MKKINRNYMKVKKSNHFIIRQSFSKLILIPKKIVKKRDKKRISELKW